MPKSFSSLLFLVFFLKSLILTAGVCSEIGIKPLAKVDSFIKKNNLSYSKVKHRGFLNSFKSTPQNIFQIDQKTKDLLQLNNLKSMAYRLKKDLSKLTWNDYSYQGLKNFGVTKSQMNRYLNGLENFEHSKINTNSLNQLVAISYWINLHRQTTPIGTSLFLKSIEHQMIKNPKEEYLEMFHGMSLRRPQLAESFFLISSQTKTHELNFIKLAGFIPLRINSRFQSKYPFRNTNSWDNFFNAKASSIDSENIPLSLKQFWLFLETQAETKEKKLSPIYIIGHSLLNQYLHKYENSFNEIKAKSLQEFIENAFNEYSLSTENTPSFIKAHQLDYSTRLTNFSENSTALKLLVDFTKHIQN